MKETIYILMQNRYAKVSKDSEERRLVTTKILHCYKTYAEAHKRLIKETKSYLIERPGTYAYDLNDGSKRSDQFELLERNNYNIRILFKKSGTIYDWYIEMSDLD